MPVTGAIPIVMPTLTNTWKRKREDDAARDDGAVQVAGHGHHPQAPPDDEQVEEQQDRRPEEPALLGERREDEVGRVLGEVVEAGLASPRPRRGRRCRPSRRR